MEELATVLAKFHREVLLPDVERIVQASEHRLRDELKARVDELQERMRILETHIQD